MIQNIAEADRRHMVRILHAANEGRLVEQIGGDFLARNPGSVIWGPVDQQTAHDAFDLGWVELTDQLNERDWPIARITSDGATALPELHAWCQANPIRR